MYNKLDDDYNEYEYSEEYQKQMEAFNIDFWEGQQAYKELLNQIDTKTIEIPENV